MCAPGPREGFPRRRWQSRQRAYLPLTPQKGKREEGRGKRGRDFTPWALPHLHRKERGSYCPKCFLAVLAAYSLLKNAAEATGKHLASAAARRRKEKNKKRRTRGKNDESFSSWVTCLCSRPPV